MIPTFFFDMDGVLFDTESESGRILQNECRRIFGCDFSENLLSECAGRDYDGCRRLFLEELGENFPFEEVWRYCEKRLKEKALAGDLPVKPGAREILSELKEKAAGCVLVTSTESGPAEFLLEKTGLRPFFRKIIGGESVPKGRGKPAPDIYLKALKITGADPEKTVVIEDSVQGVRAALDAGLSVVMVPDRVRPDAAMRKACVACVGSLSGVLPALKEKGLWS